MTRALTTVFLLASLALGPSAAGPTSADAVAGQPDAVSAEHVRPWQFVATPRGPLAQHRPIAIDSTPDGSVWIATSGRRVIRFRGLDLANDGIAGLPAPSWSLRAISMVSPTDGWVVGTQGAFARWDGEGWTEHRSYVHGKERVAMAAVYMVSPNDGWACMESVPYGTPVPSTVMRWNGEIWYFYANHQMGCRAISMASANDGWLLDSSGNLHRYDGTTWTEAPRLETDDLRDVDMIDGSNGWAVGWSTALRFDGHAWRAVVIPGLASARRVDFVSPDHGWVLTHKGSLRYDRGTWTHVPLPLAVEPGEDDPYYTYDLEMLDEDRAWIIGTLGQVLRNDPNAACHPITPRYRCPLSLPWLGGAP